MKTVSARVFWVPPEQGGRSGLPAGLQYSTVSKWPGQEDGAWPNSAWSVVLDFDRPPAEQGNPSSARARFLVNDAPDLLVPGRKFELYEGRCKVAEVQVIAIIYDDYALRKGNLIALGGNLWNQHVSEAIRNKKAGEDDLKAAAEAFFDKILPEMQNFMEQKLAAAKERKS